MNKLIYLSALMIVSILSITSCSGDDDSDVSNSSISVNGNVYIKLQSAFTGGSIADPKLGVAFRLNLFNLAFSQYPIGTKANVSIKGIQYTGQTYTNLADCIEQVTLNSIYNIDTLTLNFTQGKYQGDKVKGAEIRSLSLGTPDAKSTKWTDSDIHIDVQVNDTTMIEVKYTGTVLPDEMI